VKLYEHADPQAPHRAIRYRPRLSPSRNALLSLSAVALIASVSFNSSLLTHDAVLRPTLRLGHRVLVVGSLPISAALAGAQTLLWDL
jgi:hypothetical protein